MANDRPINKNLSSSRDNRGGGSDISCLLHVRHEGFRGREKAGTKRRLSHTAILSLVVMRQPPRVAAAILIYIGPGIAGIRATGSLLHYSTAETL